MFKIVTVKKKTIVVLKLFSFKKQLNKAQVHIN